MKRHPYQDRPLRSFWRSAVADRHVADLDQLWVPPILSPSDKFGTAGSCFAQHIGRALQARGADFLDCEPTPSMFTNEGDARRFGFGVFSCRYGNLYTARQLRQLLEEALGQRDPGDIVWERGGRYFDALRPSVDPVGLASADEVRDQRRHHLAAVRRMFQELDVLVFTLGLTECWERKSDGTVFPTAPGTIAGTYDPALHRLRLLRHRDVTSDMQAFWSLLKTINPGARMILTVSPVPLIATATDQHVLPATIHSKSVLRAAAGELSADNADIWYFPSYEIIAAHPSRGMFFDPDLRTVNAMGVETVMRHFFLGSTFGTTIAEGSHDDAGIICDEEAIETT